MNETWLKSSIGSGEIIDGNAYKIERLDRSAKSQPPDPNNPNKYRKNGGDVMIAIRHDLEISSSRMSFSCAAEILGMTLTLRNRKKIIVCTCYGVGNLGQKNHSEVQKFLHKAKTKKYISNFILIGDFNLTDVNWCDYSTLILLNKVSSTHFYNFGFGQMINTSTPINGNNLDVLLTDLSINLSKIKVLPDVDICKSDHYTIQFQINHRVKNGKKLNIKYIITNGQIGTQLMNNYMM